MPKCPKLVIFVQTIDDRHTNWLHYPLCMCVECKDNYDYDVIMYVVIYIRIIINRVVHMLIRCTIWLLDNDCVRLLTRTVITYRNAWVQAALCILTIQYNYWIKHLRVTSTIVTVAWSGLPIITSPGSEDESMLSIKFSLPSDIPSSFIGISNGTLVSPAGNVTVYGPEL